MGLGAAISMVTVGFIIGDFVKSSVIRFALRKVHNLIKETPGI